MNKFIGIGRLCSDPEIKYSVDMPIARYTVAVDRRFKKDGEPTADFIKCTAFKKQAEFAEKYLKKGTKIAFVGHIQTGSFTNKDGQKVYTTDILIDECEFCESKSSSNQQTTHETAPQTSNDNGFENIPEGIDTELPFM